MLVFDNYTVLYISDLKKRNLLVIKMNSVINNEKLNIEKIEKLKSLVINGKIFRQLKVSDYKQYISLLSQLTEVGNITEKMFTERLTTIRNNPNLHIYVISDEENDELIASGTIYIEPKFIHMCSNIGHIEDIVVSNKYRGKKYGNLLIQFLIDLSRREKCYKIKLACKEKNIGFYDKCNFKKEGYEMVVRL